MSRRTRILIIGGLVLASALAVPGYRLVADVHSQARELRALRKDMDELCRSSNGILRHMRTVLRKGQAPLERVREAREWLVLPATYCAPPDPAVRQEVRDLLLMLDLDPALGPDDAIERIRRATLLIVEWRWLERKSGPAQSIWDDK